MHYTNQITELEVVLPNVDEELSSEVLERRFEDQYERTYGKGAGFSGVRSEVTVVRGRATKSLGQPEMRSLDALGTVEVGERGVYWPEEGSEIRTPVFRQIAERCEGPLLVELPTTTVVVHEGQSIEPDEFGNLVLRIGG